jgi:hypothetical protein
MTGTAKSGSGNRDAAWLTFAVIAVLVAMVWSWKIGQRANHDVHEAFDARMTVMDMRSDIKNMEALIK